jgi:hypothetical protein
MKFSLWDTEIGNRLGRFDTQEEALAFVRTMLATYPREKLRDLSLGWRDEEDCGHEIAGDALLALAERDKKGQEPLKAGGGSYDNTYGHSRSSGDAVGTAPMAASKRGGK